jgi:copper homeostasis protein
MKDLSITRGKIQVEVCVDSIASAIAAERGGATRVELCSSLMEGGVTPSAGLIETTRAAISIPLHVMIRPRAGDFQYDSQEFETMRRDIVVAEQLGAHGIVFGILNIDGSVDLTRTRELAELARPLAVTFHRAFDMTSDLFRALDDLCTLGIDRVLTSGGEQTAVLGQQTIAQLVTKAQGKIAVMAGSGIKPDNARRLMEETGVKEIHVGLRTILPSPMLHRNPRVSMGTAQGGEYQRSVVVEKDVRRLCAVLQNPVETGRARLT